MNVLINFKICDNSKDCLGISSCTIGAFSWNDLLNAISVDKDICTFCGICEAACEVGAIRVPQSEDHFEKIKKEIEDDPRKVSDLFVDRYGAEPLDNSFFIEWDKFDKVILQASKIAVAEFFSFRSLQCLIYSIPTKELFKDMNIVYRKVLITDDSQTKIYSVQQLPALLVFYQSSLIGKIEGQYKIENQSELRHQLEEIIANCQ